MKLRQIISESLREEVREYFELIPNTLDIVSTPKGIDIHGSIKANDAGRDLKKLPWKINFCNSLIMGVSSNLRSLENFPNKAFNIITINGCTALKSLATSTPIHVTGAFKARNTLIENLEGAKITTPLLDLPRCPKLKNVIGNAGKIGRIILTDCPVFEQDPTTIDADEVVVDPSISFMMPIVRAILFREKQRPLIDIETTMNPKWEYILSKYSGKGPKEIVNLIRELHDEGYSGNAKL